MTIRDRTNIFKLIPSDSEIAAAFDRLIQTIYFKQYEMLFSAILHYCSLLSSVDSISFTFTTKLYFYGITFYKYE